MDHSRYVVATSSAVDSVAPRLIPVVPTLGASQQTCRPHIQHEVGMTYPSARRSSGSEPGPDGLYQKSKNREIDQVVNGGVQEAPEMSQAHS